jgi:crotonobetainyl-CoA:carnitine CoA-transferase CaiB-like acyl-CoA transferase
MVAAYAGLFALTGEPDRPPVRLGVAAIDMSTGMLAYSGIVSALLARERGAGGQRVDASLLESGVTLLGYQGVAWTAGGVLVEREGAGFNRISPYGVYRARDGELLVGAPSDAMWAKLCGVLGASHLMNDPRYASNETRCQHDEALRGDLETLLATADVRTWTDRLETAGVATAPMNRLDQVLQDEQVLANDMVVPAALPDGSTVNLLGLPFKLSGTPGKPGTAPPEPGQHNEMLLVEMLGLSPNEIQALQDEGAI